VNQGFSGRKLGFVFIPEKTIVKGKAASMGECGLQVF
jgi:hypothetical protein